jgi:hypothetical protein
MDDIKKMEKVEKVSRAKMQTAQKKKQDIKFNYCSIISIFIVIYMILSGSGGNSQKNIKFLMEVG